MTNKKELVLKKRELMQEILNKLSTWETESIEEAINILSTNDKIIKQMQDIDKSLTTEQLIASKVNSQNIWADIIQKQERLNEWIRSERQKTSEQLTQTSNKEKVVTSYIDLQKKSVLIGKNY